MLDSHKVVRLLSWEWRRGEGHQQLPLTSEGWEVVIACQGDSVHSDPRSSKVVGVIQAIPSNCLISPIRKWKP